MEPTIALLGPPGSGKGTQAERLRDRLGFAALATGDLLREARAAGTDLGRRAADYMDRGDLVPDELIIAMIRDAIAGLDGEPIVLDGFPRTVAQADALADALAAREREMTAAILIDVPDDVVVRADQRPPSGPRRRQPRDRPGAPARLPPPDGAARELLRRARAAAPGRRRAGRGLRRGRRPRRARVKRDTRSTMRRLPLIALLALVAWPEAAAAELKVTNAVEITRMDGTAVQVAQNLRVWCGRWEPRRAGTSAAYPGRGTLGTVLAARRRGRRRQARSRRALPPLVRLRQADRRGALRGRTRERAVLLRRRRRAAASPSARSAAAAGSPSGSAWMRCWGASSSEARR